MGLALFAWDDEAGFRAFLAGAPRALVLFRGTHCPYSATFRPHFEAAVGAQGGAWAFAVRDLSEADDAAWDAAGVKVTPTVVAYEAGAERVRLEGRMLLGIPRTRFARWLRDLPA